MMHVQSPLGCHSVFQLEPKVGPGHAELGTRSKIFNIYGALPECQANIDNGGGHTLEKVPRTNN